jgi:hypothetical protein
MYIVLEYLTYLLGALVLAGVLFGASILVMLTQSGAERLRKATRHVATQARVLAGDLARAKMFWRRPSST